MAEASKKIIVSGKAHTGKTSLVNQYLHRRFLDEYPSTIGARINHMESKSDGIRTAMIIWDLTSETRQQDVSQASLVGAEGVIYVVDISEPTTFIHMAEDIEFLKRKLPAAAILIVANKSDKVAAGDIPAIINAMSHLPDFITSARDVINVHEAFERLAEMMLG